MSYRHEASGADLSKPIAQPHVETFREVFEDFSPYHIMTGKGKLFPSREIAGQAFASNLYENLKDTMEGRKQPKKRPDKRMKVGPYCFREAGQSFCVRCADWVLSRIREGTILVPDDEMYFQIVDHKAGEGWPGGWSLVTANHNTIGGTVWLAYIRTESIPTVGPNGELITPTGKVHVISGVSIPEVEVKP